MIERQNDYKRALTKLSFLNTMLTHDKKDYIIYFQPMENKGRCKIQVTNGFDFWVEDFDYDKFETKRKSSGLEGSYNSYFEMMCKAVIGRSFDIQLDSSVQNFTLILFIQLKQGVSLKNEFDMGRPLHFDDIKEFHNVYRLFLFDIFKAKDQERMKAEQSKKPIASGRKGNADEMEEESEQPPRQGTTRKKRNTGNSD